MGYRPGSVCSLHGARAGRPEPFWRILPQDGGTDHGEGRSLHSSPFASNSRVRFSVESKGGLVSLVAVRTGPVRPALQGRLVLCRAGQGSGRSELQSAGLIFEQFVDDRAFSGARGLRKKVTFLSGSRVMISRRSVSGDGGLGARSASRFPPRRRRQGTRPSGKNRRASRA